MRNFNGYTCENCMKLEVYLCASQLTWFADKMKKPVLDVELIPDEEDELEQTNGNPPIGPT